jgi:hypothetical protein
MDTSNIIHSDLDSTTDKKDDTKPRKKVIIGLPGDNFSSKFLISFSNTIATLLGSDKYEFGIAPGVGSMVHFVRMQTLGLDTTRGITQKPFNNSDFDIWITIDSDIIFTPEHVLELLASTEEHPVVSGLYRMADLQSFAAVQNWDQKYFSEHATYEFVTQEILDKWKSDSKPKYMPVSYAGLGFFACRKEVLDKMVYPYFDGTLREVVYKDGTLMRDMSSEDVNFCQNIEKAGYDIHLNTEIRVGHLKPLVI